MFFENTLYGWGSILLNIIVVLKTIGICHHAIWILRKGTTYRNTLMNVLRPMLNTKFDIPVLQETEKSFKTPFALFTPYCYTQAQKIPGLKFFLHYIYRQPMLVLLLSLLIFFSPTGAAITNLNSILLLLLMVFSLVHLLLGRCILGYIDNYRQDFHFLHKTFQQPRKADFVRKFTFGIIIIVITSIIGFAAVYYGIYQTSASVTFNNLQSSNVPLQLIYFSVITAATIGYGDITPCYGWPQFLVSLQVIYFMGVLITLIFSLSNTFEPEKN